MILLLLGLYTLIDLFVLGFSSHSRFFCSYGDVTIYRWRAWPMYVLMAIEQWGFFNVPHLLRHGTSVYDYHLRGPVKLTHIVERLAVMLSIFVFTTKVCQNSSKYSYKYKLKCNLFITITCILLKFFYMILIKLFYLKFHNLKLNKTKLLSIHINQ